jgi:AcrR family transcriptional regulator
LTNDRSFAYSRNVPPSLSSPSTAAAGDGAATTQGRILEAATRLFAERGYHAVGMRELADAVGIRPASLYNHCASKQELLFTIAHGTMTELREGAEAAIAGQPDARARLRAWVIWHVTYHARHRARARVTDGQFRALDDDRLQAVLEARDAYERLVKGLIDDGVAAHGWVVPHRSVVTNAISTMCTAVDDWFREDGPLTADEVAAIYADLVLAALEREGRT